MANYSVGGIGLTRVPYFDVPLDAGIIGFTAQSLAEVPWGIPSWVSTDGRVLVGQAVWVIEARGHILVIDPCGAADAFLRSGPEAASHEAAVASALASAGFPVDTVDSVLMSHLDGIGMVGSPDAAGRWSALFPRARVVISERELAYVDTHPEIGGSEALRDLRANGIVDGTTLPCEIAPGVSMELTGGHSPGHAVVRIGGGAVFLGHLAINPVQVSGGIMPDQHVDAVLAFNELERELAWAAERNALVIGPLWPEPGAARVAGPPWSFEPVWPA
jgi:glyoxylase-like metal-dependent hydrolase (beta-lactamase superfamily II)